MTNLFEHHLNKNPRLFSFYYFMGILIVVLIFGLGYRQLIQNDNYEQLEEKQSLRRILQPAPRAEILDRHHKLLIGNRPIFTAVIYLTELRHECEKEYIERVRTLRDAGIENVNRDEIRTEARLAVVKKYIDPLNKLLGREESINTKMVETYFRERRLLPMPIFKDLSLHEYAILTENLSVNSPVQVFIETARYYPHGSLAAHVLGYVSASDDGIPSNLSSKHLKTFTFKSKTGKTGLEKFYNDRIAGTPGGEIWVVDPRGIQRHLIEKNLPQQSPPFVTSLDIDLQRTAEKCLEGKVGAIVALDVESGEVLALASSPTYDLNQLSPFIPTHIHKSITDSGAWLNRAIQGLYSPASPFKIISAIAFLRNNVLTPDETLECGSSYKVGNRLFHEHEKISLGTVDLRKAVKHSCNVYFYHFGLKVGAEKLAEEAKFFNLHQPTRIDLPYETTRMLIPSPAWKKSKIKESWMGGDTANMVIGQGYSLISPLQMACFAASFARNENKTIPTLLHDPSRTRSAHGAQPIGLSEEHYQAILDGLIQCADSGSAKHAKVPGITLAAKTGTGQRWLKGKELTVPWFFGFAPAEDPKIAIAIAIEGATDDLWGGTTTGPLAKAILTLYKEKYLKASLHKEG